MTEKAPQLVPLNDREIRAARMEAEGVVMREIANAVGIHRKTLYRWRDKPAYVAFVRDLRADAQRAARLTLEAGATEAARKILQLVMRENYQLRRILMVKNPSQRKGKLMRALLKPKQKLPMLLHKGQQ